MLVWVCWRGYFGARVGLLVCECWYGRVGVACGLGCVAIAAGAGTLPKRFHSSPQAKLQVHCLHCCAALAVPTGRAFFFPTYKAHRAQ